MADLVPEVLEKASTIFPRDKDGRPFLWGYQIKGLFKLISFWQTPYIMITKKANVSFAELR